jgi:hypothetical protein
MRFAVIAATETATRLCVLCSSTVVLYFPGAFICGYCCHGDCSRTMCTLFNYIVLYFLGALFAVIAAMATVAEQCVLCLIML